MPFDKRSQFVGSGQYLFQLRVQGPFFSVLGIYAKQIDVTDYGVEMACVSLLSQGISLQDPEVSLDSGVHLRSR